jgi:S-layer protein
MNIEQLNNRPSPDPSTTKYLTTAVDNIQGSVSSLTTFIGSLGGSSPTINAGDTLTGYGWSNTFEITDTGNSGIPTLHVSGIQTVTIDSDEGVTLDTTAWSSLTTLQVTASNGSDNIVVGDGTALVLNDIADDDIYTHGGSTVTINNNPAAGSYGNYVEVHGGATTTAVQINGGYDEENYIYDKNSGSGRANTITQVTTNGQVDYDTYIYSDALTQLNILSDTYHYIYVYAASGSRTLNVILNNDGNASGYSSDYWYLEDDTATKIVFSAVNVASKNFYLYAPSATSLTFNDAVGLSFYDGALIGSDYLEAAAAKSVSISGAGDFTADFSGLNAAAAIKATASTGVVTVELTNGQSFIGGSGQDVVTIGTGQTGLVTGGSNGHNEIILANDAAGSVGDISVATHFSTFGVAGSTSGVFNMSALPGYKAFDVQGSGGDVTFTHASPGSTLSIDGSTGYTITLQTANSRGASDAVTLTLGNANNSVSVAGVVLEDATGTGIGTVNIISNGPGINTLTTLGENNLTTLHLSGEAGLVLSNLPANDVTISAATDNADNTIVLGNSANVIAMGSGSNSITVGAGANSISYVNHSGIDTTTVGANASLTKLTTITGAISGDHLKIADASAFDTTAITSAQATSAGGGTGTLAGWVNGALSAAGDDLAQHHAAWFEFGNNTYVVEQSGAAGSAFGAGDTLVKLVGVVHLSTGSYDAGSSSLVL